MKAGDALRHGAVCLSSIFLLLGSVPKGDQGAVSMARSFQSRLPENQMKLHTENASLLCSQADNGLFDIRILSREYADAYRAESAHSDEVQVLALTGTEGLDDP